MYAKRFCQRLTATTVPVGKISDEAAQLIRVTEECLARGIEQCTPSKRVGDIGWAIQRHADEYGYGIVRDYTGHGIGRSMHEAPQIPNYGRQRNPREDPGRLLLCDRADVEPRKPRKPRTSMTNGRL